MHKSYLKWVGSKSRILDELLATFPKDINIYFEPFLGSGSVALNVNAKQKILSDVNPDIINCHNAVKDDPEYIIETLEPMYAMGRDEYYVLRNEFNCIDQSKYKAALFIYLNKHGFNGMCRYNKKDVFNVPVGKGVSVHFPKDEIRAFGTNIGSKVQIGCSSFERVMRFAGKEDLIYCDPPYVPASVTKSNINYSGELFTFDHHKKLVNSALLAQSKGATVIISNHDLEITRELYSDADEIVSVEAHRSVSSTNETRGKVQELIAIYRGKNV